MNIGDLAPDFVLRDQDNIEFQLYKHLFKPIIILFYPKDSTKVCTKQLCEYNDNFEKFLDMGYGIVGISVDSIDSHKKFTEKHKLKFPILSDVTKEVSIKYNALGIGGKSKRKTVVINSDKIIIYENTMLPIFFKSAPNILNQIRGINFCL